MVRHVPAIALVCCLIPSWASAQSAPAAAANAAGSAASAGAVAPAPQFTVTAASAGVHQFPTIASPVVGNVPRGSVLDVTRELGSWVRVPWPAVQDGVAYVHVSTGAMTERPLSAPSRAAVGTSAPSPGPQPVAAPEAVSSSRVPGAVPLAPPSMYVPPPAHRIGLGGGISGTSSLGLGATARMWRRDRLGVQIEVSRGAFSSATAAGRVTSMLFGASALYSMKDRLSDYFALRPYVGGGAGLQRQTLSQSLVQPNASSSGLGVRMFGGAEVTFASVPQFGVSAEAGYRWAKEAFPGFNAGGFGIAASGHWYIR